MNREQLAFLSAQILTGLLEHADFSGNTSLLKLVPAAVSAARSILREIDATENETEQAGAAAG